MVEGKILYYKDYPLVRQGNLIYYGNITDKYIIMMQVLETKKLKDLDLASKVSIQLQYTDPDISSKNRIVKKRKKGLYGQWTWLISG